MKSAIELAMERSKKFRGENEPDLTEEQKKQIAEIRTACKAKIAEVEILLQEEELRIKEIARLQADCEAKVQGIYQKSQKSS